MKTVNHLQIGPACVSASIDDDDNAFLLEEKKRFNQLI